MDETSDSDALMPTGDAVSLFKPNFGQSGRQMLDLVNRLHNIGVDVDIDLPVIAVIGQQSAGKSSLVESISGVTLPRAVGTCTRCPTECRLTYSSNSWTCRVSIRIADRTGGKSSSLQLGELITSKSDVEDRIRRAQWAILNPSALSAHGVEYFLTGDKHGENAELTFSSSCVSLEISGPDVTDLSFCDLPGLIVGVGQDGSVSDIDLVKGLVSSYIKKPSCIILLTVACETDFQNQGAQELAKTHDPHGIRTIGVLTKPDRIPQGEEPTWIPLLRNEREPLDNGWYCVKQPSSTEINEGITWSEARKREAEYFESKSVWQDLDGIYKRYLGTGNLVERLSGLLSGLIVKRLPEIHREIHKITAKSQDALNELPAAPSSEPRSEISALLYKFVWDLSLHIQGVPDDGIFQSIRSARKKFRLAVRTTSPEFQPFYKHQGKRIGKATFLFGEEGRDAEYFSKEDKKQKKKSQLTGREIYVDDVMERAERARTRELPGNYPYAVQEWYIKSFVQQWHAPAKTLCQTVGLMLEDYLHNLVHKHFKSFGRGLLQQHIQILIQNQLKKCIEQTEERIDWLFKLENGPFTLNTHSLADYHGKFLSFYRSARGRDQNQILIDTIESFSTSHDQPKLSKSGRRRSRAMAKVFAGLAEIGLHGVKPEDLVNIIAKDGTEPALVIMADVRAYFQVAYRRFTDNIPLAIDHELVRGLERNILQTLSSGLGINGPDGHHICAELAQEDQRVSNKREELLNKLERLSAATQVLYQVRRNV